MRHFHLVFTLPAEIAAVVRQGAFRHRTALSDKAVVGCDEQSVTFIYRKSDELQRGTMTLPGAEFLRRFLQLELAPRTGRPGSHASR